MRANAAKRPSAWTFGPTWTERSLSMSLKVSRPAVLRDRGRVTLSRAVYAKARSPIVSSCEGCASSSWKVTWVSAWPAKAESSIVRTLAGIHTLVSCASVKAFELISVTPSGMRMSVAAPV